MFMAVGTVFGVGGTSVISRALGEGRKDYARNVCSFCMWSCVAVGVVMAALMIIFMDPILKLMGASSGTWDYAKSYLTIVSLSGPFVLISNCYSNLVRAEGDSGAAVIGMMLGNILNIILDPIMILGLHWNITGAAIATVIGNVAGAVYYILFYLRGKSVLSISPKYFTLKDNVAGGVFAIGIPAALGSLLMSISSILMNSQMAKYGDMALAGIGVAMKTTMITGMFCLGPGQGIQPLLGYCIGSGNKERYRGIFKFSMWFAIILSAVLTGLCYLFLTPIVKVFLTDAEALSYGISFARIILTTSFLFGIYYVILNAIQAKGAATESLIVNLARQGIIYIPIMFILGAAFNEMGLVWAQPVTDILSMILAVYLYVKSERKETRKIKTTSVILLGNDIS